MEKKSIFGLDERSVAALSYLFGPFSGIVVLIMERENKFVRFHALQSTLWFLMLWVVWWVLSVAVGLFSGLFIIGVLFGVFRAFISAIFWFLNIASTILLIYKAYTGTAFKIPIIGNVAWGQINK
ncbi:MAG: DUF4870 domain-containing protein [Defluviitaleaceae bacterium]|nr:DUF4870 domain-containing protein [Defluviitaleaceae bacterium]